MCERESFIPSTKQSCFENENFLIKNYGHLWWFILLVPFLPFSPFMIFLFFSLFFGKLFSCNHFYAFFYTPFVIFFPSISFVCPYSCPFCVRYFMGLIYNIMCLLQRFLFFFAHFQLFGHNLLLCNPSTIPESFFLCEFFSLLF